jgi:hypothetical protein
MTVTFKGVVGLWVAAAIVGLSGCSRRTSPEPAASPGPMPHRTASPSATARPKLAIEQLKYDFGKMETNAAGRHEFVLANRGDQPLVLSRTKGSCGCCTCLCDARLPEQGRILPGASAKVRFEWSIKQYTGDFRQSENLATNDPERPEVTLEVSGRITPTVRVVPAQLVFTRVAAGEPAVGEVYLYGYRSEALKILGHELSDPTTADSFKISYRPLSADQVANERDAQSGCLLRVEVKSILAAGPFRQRVLLKTNAGSAPDIEIPVEGTVGSEIAVAGFGWDEQTGVLTLGAVAMAKGATRQLRVVARGPHAKNVRLKLAKLVPDLLQVDVGQGKPIGQGAVIQIPLSIRIPPGNRAANHLGSKASDLGQIVFETGHPQQPELRILVRFAVRPDPAK